MKMFKPVLVAISVFAIMFTNTLVIALDDCYLPVEVTCPIPLQYCFLRAQAQCSGHGYETNTNYFALEPTPNSGVDYKVQEQQVKCYASCICEWDSVNGKCVCNANTVGLPTGHTIYNPVVCVE